MRLVRILLEGLLVTFLGALALYLLRHDLATGLLAAIAICAFGLLLIWLMDKHRTEVGPGKQQSAVSLPLPPGPGHTLSASVSALPSGGTEIRYEIVGGGVPAEPVPEPHRIELCAVAGELFRWAVASAPLRWVPAGYQPSVAVAFRRHFKDLSKRLDDFDSLVADRDICRYLLRDHVWQSIEAKGMDRPPYVISALFPYVIADRAMSASPSDASGFSFTPVLGFIQVGPHAVINLATTNDPTANKRAINELLLEAQTMDIYWEVAKASELVLVERNPLLLELGEIRDSHVIIGLRGCALCGGPSEWSTSESLESSSGVVE